MLGVMSIDSAAIAMARGITKRFGSVEALASLDLDILPGEVLGLIGPSGSGKTSLARVLVGLLAPDSGEVRLFGEKLPCRKTLSRVGYMAQADALYGDLDGLSNLSYFFPLTYAGNALRDLMIHGRSLGSILPALAAIWGFGLLFLALAVVGLGRFRKGR